MKKFIFSFFAVAIAISSGNKVSAQETRRDSCSTYLSYYSEYYKQKNYKEALPHWRKAIKYCNPISENVDIKGIQTMLIDGQALMRQLIAKNAAKKDYRKALVDSLMMLHDLRIQNFPKYSVTATNNKGLDIAQYLKNDNKAAFEGLDNIIETLGAKAKPSILLNNLNAAIALFQESGIDAEKVIATYQRNIAIVKEIQPDKTISQETIDKAKSDLEGLFITSNVASCDNLIALFTPRFEADPENVELATNIVKMMSNADKANPGSCIKTDLFLRAITSMHKNDPSAQSAYFLYKLNVVQDNVAAAESYLEEAVKLSENVDPSEAADYNMQYADFCLSNGHKGKALAAAQKAIELDSSFAPRAYFVIGSIWGSTTCGGDEIARRAPYWVAVDYMQKARVDADPDLAEKCNAAIARYKAYFPTTQDAFMFDLTDGQSYTVSCNGMRAVTTVRTQK